MSYIQNCINPSCPTPGVSSYYPLQRRAAESEQEVEFSEGVGFPSCQSLPSSPREALQHSMEWPPKDVVLLPSPCKANLGAAKSYPLHGQFCIANESMQLLSEWMFPSLSRKHLLTYLCLLLTREKGGIGKCMWKTPGWRGQAQESLYHECHVMCLYRLHFLEILTWSWMAQVPCGLQMATGNSHYNSSL